MSNPDQTIEQILQDANDIRVSTTQPFGLFLQWLAVTVLSTGTLVTFMVPRPDLHQQLISKLYVMEIISLFLVILTTAISAVWLCYPDLRQKAKLVFLPLIPAALFVILSWYRLMNPEWTALPLEKSGGVNCTICVVAFAVAPGFWMFHLLRRNATTYPKSAGAVSFLASSSIGLLVLKLVEANDSVSHLIVWHLSPMILLAFLGALLGRKYLSW